MVASKFKQMLQDENGVSPVIGVILMVAVTVVLGAVIGAFVFGIGDSLGQPAPNAQFEFDNSNGEVEILHDGGDSITGENTGNLSVSIQATNAVETSGWFGNGVDTQTTSAIPSGSSATAGTSIVTIGTTGGPEVTSGDTIKLQWESNGGDTSSVLATYEAS